MTTQSQLNVLVDASVLIPSAPRDTLLRIVEKNLFFPFWSMDILDEVERNLIAHGLASIAGAQRLTATMIRVFPDALVTGYQLDAERATNDPNDRHVLGAAVKAGANILLTQNLRHFPESSLSPFTIRALSIDTFLLERTESDPDTTVEVIQEQAEALINPPQTLEDVLTSLALHAPAFVRLMRRLLQQ